MRIVVSSGSVVLVAALALALTGCAGSDDATGGLPDYTPPPSSASTAVPGEAAAPTSSAPTPSGGRTLIYDPDRDAAADIGAARRQARRDGTQVLIDFGADRCVDCRALDRLYRAPRVSALLAKRYTLVRVDVGELDHNLALSERYGDVVTNGIPALVILDTDGSVLTTTKDGLFVNARTMSAAALKRYLLRWVRPAT